MGCQDLNTVEAKPVEESILSYVYALSNSPTPGIAPLSHAENLLKVQRYVMREEPVRFVLPAFPAKSPNRRKTFGPMPDLADLEGLRTLQKLCTQIRSVYSGGAQIVICSDGRVFADVVGVSDMDVENYKRGIEHMIARFGLSSLSTFHLEDIFGTSSFARMRERLVRGYAEPIPKLRARMIEDPALRLMFNGIHRFMFEDVADMNPESSREKSRTHAKSLAYQVIQRSNAWSRLVAAEFPQALRLSIHPQMPSSEKIGVQLVPASSNWATPWHGVLVTDGIRKTLMKREKALALGSELKRSAEGYMYFHARSMELSHAL
jgi:pyoverdine/dityrosine biosynthesis protein Dit1